MKMLIPTVLTVLTFAAADRAAAFPYPPTAQVPNINGTWFMNGDPNKPTRIIQRQPDGNALFVNENGSEAWGMIRGNNLWIPAWENGRGQQGFVRGDRILWPGGSFWSRQPLGPGGPGWPGWNW
jgi:hypothetical protein